MQMEESVFSFIPQIEHTSVPAEENAVGPLDTFAYVTILKINLKMK